METTVYQLNISIFHKSLDLLISSILNNNDKKFLCPLTCTPTGMRPLERPRGRWEDNIVIDIKKWVAIGGIGLIQLRI